MLSKIIYLIAGDILFSIVRVGKNSIVSGR